LKRQDCKYVWTCRTFDEWVKKEIEKHREKGIKIGTAGVTKSLMERVILPNDLSLAPKPEPIKIQRITDPFRPSQKYKKVMIR
jgi:hypothetical protein